MRTEKRHNKVTSSGMTLMEMLIVTIILSVISTAIYSTLSSGLKIWHKLNKPVEEEDLVIFFERFSSDIKTSFKFTGIDFKGKSQGLEFAALVNSPALGKRSVGRITYSYDAYKNILNRQEADYSLAYQRKGSSSKQAIAKVKYLKFEYYFYDETAKKYNWAQDWRDEKLPLAVRIILELKNGATEEKLTRTVNIPAGG
ncbi:MAG: type II secretion system protein GspJ [Candidatus Omnitrophota bacterium]